MTKIALRDSIKAALWEHEDMRSEDNIKNITTFEDAGILTYESGMTVVMTDGSVYQVVVMSGR